jgi:hypothetical protein
VTNVTPQILALRDLTSNTKTFVSMTSIDPGDSVNVVVPLDALGGITYGSFSLFGQAGVSYTIAYNAVDEGALTVMLSDAPADCVAGFAEPFYALTQGANVKMNVYVGVLAGTQALRAYVVPFLAWSHDQPNNVQDFVNSMFWPNVRQKAIVQACYNQGSLVPYVPADYTGGQVGKVIGALLGSVYSGDDDGRILNFLMNYLAPAGGTPLTMWVPTFSYYKPNSKGLPIYQLTGYKSYVPVTNAGGGKFNFGTNFKIFLELLVGGAHFVAISAYADFDNQNVARTGARSLYDAFINSGLPQSKDPANSHYRGVLNVNQTGRYYLDIDSDWAPEDCGLLTAVLFGSTVNVIHGSSPPVNEYNTFMQLEGWQTSKTRSARHEADYKAFNDSLWNYSTFGACPYSERRATTVFLAPPQWKPSICSTTFMMPYVGADTPQSWLDTSVVQVPPGTPATPY